MWIVRNLAGAFSKWLNMWMGYDATRIMSDYAEALKQLRPKFDAVKQKAASDPKGAVDDLLQMFDAFYDTNGYADNVLSMIPTGRGMTLLQLINPLTGPMQGAASAVGWLAYKRLLGKAVKEAKRLQQRDQAGKEPAFTEDLQSWSDRQQGEKESVQEDFTRTFGDEAAPVPLTQRKEQIPSTSQPIEPPSTSGARFSLDPSVLKRLLSGV
jgi:hypothetical protein